MRKKIPKRLSRNEPNEYFCYINRILCQTHHKSSYSRISFKKIDFIIELFISKLYDG